MKDWDRIVVTRGASLGEAIARVDAAGKQMAIVLDEHRCLLGILTDGDIRRAILRGRGLETPVVEVMNPSPMVADVDTSREQLLAMMRRHVFHHLPLVDADRRVVDLITLDDLIGAVERPNWVVLMAGGLGTRLRPLTEDCPKPMLQVAGKPILEGILESFVDQGFRRFFLSVNYKAEMVRNHFGNGEKWGVEVTYLHETQRLGTAGALSLLPARPADPLIVMNGDLLTRAAFDKLVDFHEGQSAVATMTVREYGLQVPYGVVHLNGTQIEAIEEKPVQRFFVNAGIYVLSPAVLDEIPQDKMFDMPMLFERLLATEKPVTAYPLREYWLDIGRLEEFERAQREWGERRVD
jgi:dTDP-glucose pyrophosphorylase